MNRARRERRARCTAADTMPYLVVGDGCGNVFEIPELRMAAMALGEPRTVDGSELIDLPNGSELFELPGRTPVGYDPRSDAFVQVPEYEGLPVVAVAAFMAPAHMQLAGAAWMTQDGALRLPFYNYAAVGWHKGQFRAAGVRVDPDNRQDLEHFDCDTLERRARRMLSCYAGNRLVEHLMSNCVLRYGCPAARNLAMGRWECPVPTSPGCNAACIGCISQQPGSSSVQSPQHRLAFVPTVEEITAFAVPHLEKAARAVISFGQGCEGEPLTQARLLIDTVRAVRSRTSRGIVNLNTNGSLPHAVRELFESGLDSIRISVNSARRDLYNRYHRPQGYTFDDVRQSLREARGAGGWTSINYFVFPGLTDTPAEMAALEELIEESSLNMIQARNLNMDPEWYASALHLRPSTDAIGMRAWLDWVRERFPWVKVGYFNPPRSRMLRRHYRAKEPKSQSVKV